MVEWDVERLYRAPRVFPTDSRSAAGIQALFYEGLPWKGRATKVFAWMGLPQLEEGQTCPGVVLVHGGGGTAFDFWVRLWTERGYAAIAMDLCGCVSEPPPTPPGGERGVRPRDGVSGREDDCIGLSAGLSGRLPVIAGERRRSYYWIRHSQWNGSLQVIALISAFAVFLWLPWIQ